MATGSRPRWRFAILAACVLMAFPAWLVQHSAATFTAGAANLGNAFGAAATFGCTPPVIHPTWISGFENGVGTAAASSGLLDIDWTGGATITADTAVKRNGAYSLKIVRPSGQIGGLSRSIGTAIAVTRFTFRFNALPGSDLKNFAGLYDSASGGGDALHLGYDSATQKLEVTFQGGTARLSSSTVSANTWYVLDVRANFGANPHTADWQLNGVAQTQATKAATAELVNELWLGPDNTDAAVTVWFDDVLISTTSADYPVGDGKVLALGPDGMGTSSDPTAKLSTEAGAWGATTWNKLDEVPLTSTTDYVRQTSTGAVYVETTFADTAEDCVNGVMAEVSFNSSAATTNSASTRVSEGGTERVVYTGDMGNTTLMYRSATVNPASGDWTWTKAKLNGLVGRVGFATSVAAQPRWQALMLEYNVDL